MFPKTTAPQFEPGTRVVVVQHVRVGHRRWRTETVGTVELEGNRPVGGMEMGGKALYCHQPTLRIRHDDGEISLIAVDERTEIRAAQPPSSTTSAVAIATTAPPETDRKMTSA